MASAVSRIEGLWGQAEPIQKKAMIYAAVLGGGVIFNNRIALGIGLGGLAGAIIEMYTDGSLTKFPGQMNAYFQTQGKLSAMRGPGEARLIRRRQIAARRGYDADSEGEGEA